MNKGILLIVTVLILMLPACTTDRQVNEADKDREAIIKVMRDQETAWNKGDMHGFMAGYAQHDSTLFVGKTRVNYGWQTVLDSYLKAYPDKAAMGKLHFDLIRVVPLDEKNAYVVGKWTLIENEKPASGHFVLIFEKTNAGWRIIVDGTS